MNTNPTTPKPEQMLKRVMRVAELLAQAEGEQHAATQTSTSLTAQNPPTTRPR